MVFFVCNFPSLSATQPPFMLSAVHKKKENNISQAYYFETVQNSDFFMTNVPG